MTKGQGYGRLVSDALVRDVPTCELETPLEAAAEPLDGRWPLHRGRRGAKGTFGLLRPNAEGAARDDRGPRPLACSASSPARRARARDGAGSLPDAVTAPVEADGRGRHACGREPTLRQLDGVEDELLPRPIRMEEHDPAALFLDEFCAERSDSLLHEQCRAGGIRRFDADGRSH